MPARRLALNVLRRVTENGVYASLSLDEHLHASTLAQADRRLAARLVYDTLDNLIYLDWALAKVMARPDTDIRLVNILRLAACQLLLEDRIPDMAATDTAVKLCVDLGMEGLKGVCNGILRSLIRLRDEGELKPDPADPAQTALRLSVPNWLLERLSADWGGEAAEAMLTPRTHIRHLILRPNLLKLTDAQFEELLDKKVWEKRPGLVPHAWYVEGAADIGADNDFKNGLFSIQSEGSMLAAMALDVRRGWKVLDCCAAPGGKSCLMSELMGDTGRVIAWDVYPHRVELIQAQQKRLHLENIRPVVRDATQHREDLDFSMDAVLLDAPCSGTGDLADKPDLKLRLKPENIDALVRTQAQLLDAVCPYVKEGGTLVYATCSILREENEAQVLAFLERHPEFDLRPLPETIPERFRQWEGVGLQLLPHRDGVGGFYLCRLRRRFT
ncbi:MAG: 16S rRNA (cytosine(967)-C(5))-methyltransferase RsmB [Clostridia bacterium]|nr:16S rRNA (cytosine(967)-C(5))-methyltransferase RsmB [Clostridia bacterium]